MQIIDDIEPISKMVTNTCTVTTNTSPPLFTILHRKKDIIDRLNQCNLMKTAVTESILNYTILMLQEIKLLITTFT